MFRVLHVMRSLNAGGIGTFIMNIYREIDHNKIQFDFAITNAGLGEYGQEILDLGGHIYFISEKGNENISDGIVQLRNLYKLCNGHKFDAIHCHYYFANAEFLLVAKIAGIKKRVSHCHNTRTKEIGATRKIFEWFSRKLLFSIGTDFLGCSRAAAVFLYGEKAVNSGRAKVLYNGINYKTWNIDNFDIQRLKKKYGIEKSTVFVFVGRFEEQKNPIFALEVFSRIHKRLPNTMLLVVGYGSMGKVIKEKILEMHIEDSVRLLPANSNVVEIQAISNIMLAPSLWEGFGIAFIEAQKMKTFVFASLEVPVEVNMGYSVFLPLDIDVWEKEIIDYVNNKHIGSKLEYDKAKLELFNVKHTTKELVLAYK